MGLWVAAYCHRSLGDRLSPAALGHLLATADFSMMAERQGLDDAAADLAERSLRFEDGHIHYRHHELGDRAMRYDHHVDPAPVHDDIATRLSEYPPAEVREGLSGVTEIVAIELQTPDWNGMGRMIAWHLAMALAAPSLGGGFVHLDDEWWDPRTHTRCSPVSSANPGDLLVEKLFASEVPEIGQGTVRLTAIARKPGTRTKVAVASNDDAIDPVAACVGANGERIRAIVAALGGERLDIVPYHPTPATFVCSAVAPAQVKRVIIDDAAHRMELVITDDTIAGAIGEAGDNARLAARLTGWRLDFFSVTKYETARSR